MSGPLIVIGHVAYSPPSLVAGFTAIGRSGGAVTAYVRDAADAPVYAAAPELLAAAKMLSEVSDAIYTHMSTGEAAAMHEAWEAMDAAIAKAEGRS
jgi:hypothetical protein